MNNIYKVIWSKAKNCYVVASEIARSHTKSASGSEKIGGVARHALLALGAACAIACGGFVNVGAVEYEHVDVQTTGTSTATVYTKNGTESYVDHALTHFDTKTQVDDKIKALKTGDVATNKDNITALQTTTTDHGQKITANTTQIANNTAAIAKKIDTETAEAKLALKANAADVYTKADVNTELAKKADVTALDGKADKSYVDTAVAGAVTTAGTNVDAKLAAYATTAEVDGKIADEVNARNNAITTTIEQERHDRDAAIDNAINGEVTERNQAIHDAIELEKTNRDAAITNAKLELQGKITGEETERKEADTAFNNRLTTAEGKIGANETAIGELKAKDTALEGKINAEKTEREAKDNAILGRIGKVADDGNYIKNSNTNSVSKNLKALDAQAKINADAIVAETAARTNKDTELEGKINTLDGNVTTAQGDINDLKAKDIELEGRIHTNEGNIETNKNAIAAIDKRTAGIGRDDATSETTIENNVKVNSIGDVTAKGQLTAYGGVNTGTGDITTKGDVNAGSLNVENASHLKGDVTMDNNLTVKGDTTLKGTKVDGKLAVTDDADLKNTKVDGTLITTGKATFQEAVEMDKGLTVTGDTKLKATTVDGKLTAGDADLKNTQVGGTLGVTGATTLSGELKAEKDATFEKNVTVEKDLTVNGKLNVGEIYLENNKLDAATGKKHDSATAITADGISNLAKVTDHGHTTESQFTHNEKGTINYAKDGDSTDWTETRSDVKADGVNTEVKDSKGNRTNTSQTASENKTYLEDKDSKNTNSTIDTAKGYDKTIKGENGKTSTKQDELNITNTAEQGTIKNDAMNIENNATGDMTNNVGGKLTTTVTGQATENFNGGLDTNVTGKENHTVTGDQNIHVTGKQTNEIGGDQENTIGGNQTTTVEGNVKEDYKKDLTTTVGGNELHEVTGTKTENVTGMVKENYSNGQETNVTGNQDIHVTGKQTNKIDGDQENTIGGDQKTTVTGDISNMAENITNEAKTSLTDKVGDNTRVLDSEGITDTVPGAGGKGSTFKQRIDAIMGNVKTDAGESEVTQKGDEITSVVGKGEATNSRVTQKKGSLEAAVTDGTNTNVSYDVANASAKQLTDGTKVNKVLDNLDSSEKTITNGTYTTSKLQTALDITNTAKDGTITNDAKNIVNNASGNMTNTVGGDLTTTVSGNELHEVTGKQTNKIDGDQENTIGGNQTTTVTGDISNKAENITNEANTKLTDKVGENTRVLDSEGITDTVGGSTFKQRIDKIMMESKDVSIKAKETLTNEAKVITNKASEVINNEAVNINNTATGIIASKASEIKNQADKLISNKVGENTWENMENGKITTSIKDGAKQNLTQSDAAGTTQSTVDGGKSTVTIQNADGLADAVTDGTNTSVQNQTASAIAAAVKDGAGNENASVANATTSVNTIKSGSKANTVISTADGTSFINSEAAAPVGDGTEVKTTIKGNTITTGKVTMDYAEVMKDLGVRGNANITGKTTTGSLEVTGTSTLKGDVTMESSATVKKNLTVEGNTNLKNTKVDGTLDVTQKATFSDSVSIAKDLSVDGNATIKGDVTAKSYKVGDKTYISAAGINANDQKITNVADGSISEGSKDAVNGGQLYTVKNDLEGKVNKVGANAAAMANLHPMEFDPDSKWNIAAAIGNYGSETAAALGAFYRPNDDVMVNLSTAFGTGENMVGGGVSVRLGKSGNKLSREENNALKAQVDDLTARMDALLSVLNPNMSKDFPDVPENHWAYEAVSRLAGNDIVQGYPDGEFHGERTMTRYEMAEIIYKALSRGAEAEKELVEEFKPELQAMAASEKATAERAEG